METIEEFEVRLNFKVTAKIPTAMLESLEKEMVEDGFITARDYLVDMASQKFRAANILLTIKGENSDEATKLMSFSTEDAECYACPEPDHPDMDDVTKAIKNNKEKIREFWNSIDLGESALLLDKPDDYQI